MKQQRTARRPLPRPHVLLLARPRPPPGRRAGAAGKGRRAPAPPSEGRPPSPPPSLPPDSGGGSCLAASFLNHLLEQWEDRREDCSLLRGGCVLIIHVCSYN